jgi:hypothetical protein
MIRKSTWITLGLFIVVLAFAIYWTSFRAPESPEESTPMPQPPWSLFSSEIEGLKVEDFESGESVELARDSEGGWARMTPEQGPVDSEMVEQSISWLASPSVTRQISAEGDLTQFGLSEPRGSVTILLTDGSSMVLLIGDNSPTSSMTYTLVPDSPDVLLVSKYDVNSILEFIDLELVPTPTPEEVEVESTETAVP